MIGGASHRDRDPVEFIVTVILHREIDRAMIMVMETLADMFLLQANLQRFVSGTLSRLLHRTERGCVAFHTAVRHSLVVSLGKFYRETPVLVGKTVGSLLQSGDIFAFGIIDIDRETVHVAVERVGVL